MYMKELLIFGFFLVLCGYAAGYCDVGWAEYKEDCMFFMNRRDNWINAEDHCRKMGAWLASDDNPGKHSFIAMILNVLRNIRIYPHFLGATDFAFENSYRWLETGDAVSYTHWGAGQPNGTMDQNCLALQWVGTDLVWVDEKCTNSLFYICEKPSNATPPQIPIGRRRQI